MQAVFNQIDRFMGYILGNPYLSSALTLFLILYGSLAAPNLPPMLASLFANPLFRLLIIFLILIMFNYNPTVAILTAVGFVLSLVTLNKYHAYNVAMNLGDRLKNAAQRMAAGVAPAQATAPVANAVNGRQVSEEDEVLVEDVVDVSPVGASMDNGHLNAAMYPQADYVCELSGGGCCGGGGAPDMVCRKPMPQSADLALPPQSETPEQVAAVMNCACEYQGPQGMEYPQGYAGPIQGASL